MTREEIIAAIDEELGRLRQVRSLLQSSNAPRIFDSAAPRATTTRKKRVLSPEARERIAEAQKRRWAKQKKQTPKKQA